MRKVKISELKSTAQKLIRSTPCGEIKRSRRYVCDRLDKCVYVARLDVYGRAYGWVEVEIRKGARIPKWEAKNGRTNLTAGEHDQ